MSALYKGIAQFILWLHDVILAPVFGYDSGAAWGLSIVLMVVVIRLVLIPLFVRQIRVQRKMQLLQPELVKLRQKYKNDRQALGEATMALYKEHGANPLTGCLPLIVQAPIFYALFRVLDHVKPSATTAAYGLSVHQLKSFGSATIFGAPIASSFTNPLDHSVVSVRLVTGLAMVLCGVVTFLSQRLVMTQRNATLDDNQAKMQRIMLYLAPLFILAFGWRFPLGVLVYWVTSYTWTAVQTYVVVKKMPVVPAGGLPAPGTASAAVSGTKPAPGAKPLPGAKAPSGRKPTGGGQPPVAATPPTGPADGAARADGGRPDGSRPEAAAAGGRGPAANRPPGPRRKQSRAQRKRKGGR